MKKSMYQQYKANRVDRTLMGDGSSSTQAITLTAEDLVRKGKNGTTFVNVNSGLATYTLPPALVGYSVKFSHRGTGGTKIVPATGEMLQGTHANGYVIQGTANQYISNTVSGTRVHLECVEDGKWEIVNVTGVWALA